MDDRTGLEISPYRVFSRADWAKLRADTPMTLFQHDIDRLRSLNDKLSINEVEAIYLPLSRLLWLYCRAAQNLHNATSAFLGKAERKVPYVIGMAGSVAVGKSTSARVLQALLRRWPTTPKVDLVTTDGFLYPNAVLQRENLMERKGFPESYDTAALLRFLNEVKSGRGAVTAPVYSHLVYDVVGDTVEVDRPDILILEGLNVLQPARLPKDGRAIPFVSDFFDFSIYLDADEDLLHRWYIERFMRLRDTAFRDPKSFFRKYAELDADKARRIGEGLWNRINLVNLRENILPTRQRADLILRKGESHLIDEVWLRKL